MNAIATQHNQAVKLGSFNELMRFSEIAADSGMVPKDYAGRPGAILIAVQMGSELGLSPMQAIQNIAVVNGRPSVWGDALLALVKASPICDDVIEVLEGQGDQMVAICTAKRKGKAPVEACFSVQDAKDANLWSKQGPWKQYPKRMLQMRARGFALRDAFPDVLRGLITSEEAHDIPQDDFRTTVSNQRVVDVTPQQATRQKIKEERPVNHVEFFTNRLKACSDTNGILALEKKWEETQGKARDAGRPISDEVLSDVTDLFADRYGFLHEQERQKADEDAGVPAEGMPE